jgi:hypothetical protein
MHAKVDEIDDHISRLSVFVPDIGGPRALPFTRSPATSRCGCSAACARCLRYAPPAWSR